MKVRNKITINIIVITSIFVIFSNLVEFTHINNHIYNIRADKPYGVIGFF